ncbi:unnamed protein product [Cylindrotheca closterium]|uniref:Cyclin C-terminal domain-containing protein n=1 Tax=Cylindrotheca closterium TaxID=2856 RepID=A0AAD2FIL5_9STRA|nr:unnamed protein product [Cylindrotheca closterium]
MESIMLKTLDWRLNPPTVQSFIYLWGNHLYNGGLYAMESIERACFLAEIAVFDTLLASKGRALLAIAALIEGMVGFGRCGAPAYEQVEAAILRKLKTVFGIHYAQEEIKCIRNRLSHIYTKTSQYQSDYSNQSDASTSSRMVPYNGENKVNKIQHHQESVGICRNMIKTKYLQSPRSVRTKCEQG